MHWCKESYKKNTKQHLHGGKRERLGSFCQVDQPELSTSEDGDI